MLVVVLVLVVLVEVQSLIRHRIQWFLLHRSRLCRGNWCLVVFQVVVVVVVVVVVHDLDMDKMLDVE